MREGVPTAGLPWQSATVALRFPVVPLALSLGALTLSSSAGAAAPRYRHFPGQPRSASTLPTNVIAPHLNYYGGKVIAHAKMVAVFWGPPAPAGFADKVSAYYRALVASPLFDFAAEYDTNINSVNGKTGTNQSIGHGTFVNGITIAPSVTVPSITGQDIEDELGKQIDAHVLPPPDDDTLYAVHLAPGVSVTSAGGSSCQAYCSYHSSVTHGGAVIYYALLPDHSPPSACAGCGESRDWFENLAGSISHEVLEAITDADVGNDRSSCGPAWCDPAAADGESPHAEIGDICELGSVTEAPFVGGDGKTWIVQREWSNVAQACIVSAQTATTVTLDPLVGVRGHSELSFAVHTRAPAMGAPTVVLSTFPLPPGVTAAFDRASLTAGQSTTLRLTFTAEAPADFTLGVSGEAMSSRGLAAAEVTTPDFSAAAAAGTVALTAGATTQVSITTATIPAGAPALPLTATSALTGVTAAIAPAGAQVGQSATVALTLAHGLPSGSLAIPVTLSNGFRSHAISLQATVDGDDFSLGAPASLHVSQGSSSSMKITSAVVHGQAVPLALSITGLPFGVTAQFEPPAGKSGDTFTLKLSATDTVPPETGSAQVVAAGPVASESATVSLVVTQAGCTSAGVAMPWLASLLVLLRRRRSERVA